MRGKVLVLLFCFFFGFLKAEASPISLKFYGGLGWLEGGDLNKSIRGWRNYSRDRNRAPYSFDSKLRELHGFLEGGFEVQRSISERLSMGIGLGFLGKRRKSLVSWKLDKSEDYFHSPSDFGSISLEEEGNAQPEYWLQAVPVTLSIYYSFPLRKGIKLFLKGGVGYYFGRMTLTENYDYRFDYMDDKNLSGSVWRFVDRYESSGTYFEETTSRTFGLQGGGSIEIPVRGPLFLIFEALGRWADFREWKGKKRDAYAWNHSWGFWGAHSDRGEREETLDGKLWLVEFQSDETGNSYPRLIFSERKPLSSSYLEGKLARVNLNGLSLRAGLRLNF